MPPPTRRAKRRRLVLDGPWKFQLDADDRGEKLGWYTTRQDRSGWAAVPVPGPWDLYDKAYWGYEGIGWYAIQVARAAINRAAHQRLVFHSVHNHAKVWVNGRLVAEHLGGYLPLEIDLSAHLGKGSQLIVIRADNRPRTEWLPGTKTIEWVQYGGILQPVELVTTSKVHIAAFFVNAVPAGRGATVSLEAEIHNRSRRRWAGTLEVSISANGKTQRTRVAAECRSAGVSKVMAELELERVTRWSLDEPHLYRAHARLLEGRAVLDRSDARFGVRTIEARGSRILLNGKPIQIRGFCRYDEVAGFGTTVPEPVIRKDLLSIKRSGANLIRVHYPPSPVHHRIMDEIGLLLMQEIPFNWWRAPWHGPARKQNDQLIIQRAEQALEHMVRRDRNHPCLVIWSMCNESQTADRLGISAMRRLIRRTRELDATRLVSFVVAGSGVPHLAFDQADLVCENLYYGLFHSKLVESIGGMRQGVYAPTLKELRRARRHFGSKPLLVSEFGAHGMRGLFGDQRFSEDFQVAYLEAVWRAIQRGRAAGGIVWAWADYYHRRNFISGPPTFPTAFGPYGVVTVDRKPKRALTRLSELWKGKHA